jgi:hypothetical protein
MIFKLFVESCLFVLKFLWHKESFITKRKTIRVNQRQKRNSVRFRVWGFGLLPRFIIAGQS